MGNKVQGNQETVTRKDSRALGAGLPKFQIYPHGLSLGQGEFKPAMIFKDQAEKEVLPVWLDSLEANLILAQTQSNSRASVHKATIKIFRSLQVALKSLYIDDVAGNVQFATAEIAHGGKTSFVKVRASEAISLGLNVGASFYTDQNVVEKSRATSLEMLLHATDPAHLGKGSGVQDLH